MNLGLAFSVALRPTSPIDGIALGVKAPPILTGAGGMGGLVIISMGGTDVDEEALSSSNSSEEPGWGSLKPSLR